MGEYQVIISLWKKLMNMKGSKKTLYVVNLQWECWEPKWKANGTVAQNKQWTRIILGPEAKFKDNFTFFFVVYFEFILFFFLLLCFIVLILVSVCLLLVSSSRVFCLLSHYFLAYYIPQGVAQIMLSIVFTRLNILCESGIFF